MTWFSQPISVDQALAIKKAAQRENILLCIRAIVNPDVYIEAVAFGRDLSLEQLSGYYRLLCIGEDHKIAGQLMARCPDQLVDMCVSDIVYKQMRGMLAKLNLDSNARNPVQASSGKKGERADRKRRPRSSH